MPLVGCILIVALMIADLVLICVIHFVTQAVVNYIKGLKKRRKSSTRTMVVRKGE